MDIGTRIVLRRKALGLQQKELARRAQMCAAQLCQVENGRVSPSFVVVERIAAALDTDIPGLFSGATVKPQLRKEEPPARTDYIPIRAHEPDAAIAVKALEKISNVPVCTLALNLVPRAFQGGGGALAEELRGILGLGTAPVGDLNTTLRYRGVRIVETKFAKSVGSVALWDAAHNAPVILLNSGVTAERRRYRLVYELGSAALFASIGVRLDETLEQHRFLTDFTASFLMPGVAVRTCVAAVGIQPDSWKLAEVLPLKTYFGVSAEAFVLRLEELGLIVPSLRIALRDQLRAYYKKHPKAMEPQVTADGFELENSFCVRASASKPKRHSTGLRKGGA